MLRQKNNLSNVRRIVGNLPVDGLQDRVRLGANGDGAHYVFGLEGVDGGEDTRPAFIPPLYDVGAGGCGLDFEFAIAKAVWLFAVGGKEVGEAGAHVAGQMLDENGDGVGFGIEGDEKVVIF